MLKTNLTATSLDYGSHCQFFDSFRETSYRHALGCVASDRSDNRELKKLELQMPDCKMTFFKVYIYGMCRRIFAASRSPRTFNKKSGHVALLRCSLGSVYDAKIRDVRV